VCECNAQGGTSFGVFDMLYSIMRAVAALSGEVAAAA